METLKSTKNNLKWIFFMVTGIIMLGGALYLYFFEKTNSRTSLILNTVLALLFIAQALYYYLQKPLSISWEEQLLKIEFPGGKKQFYTQENCKSMSLTSKHIIINAGRGNGQMISLKRFSDKDKEKIIKRFEKFGPNYNKSHQI